MNPHSASDATSARVRACVDRQLTAAEVRARLEQPIDDGERSEVLSLVRWFRRRYADTAERLAYVRRAYARWQQGPRAAPSDPRRG